MSMWNSLFGSASWSNPANAGMPYLQQIPGTISPYYQPYIDTGLNSMNQYYQNASQWATPQGASQNYNDIAAGYTTSPYAQYQTDQMEQAAAQSAAASGQAGTPAQQAAVENQANQISSRDEQAYINSILGIENQGQQGLGALTGLGYNASNTLAEMLAKNLGAEAGMSYAGAANQNIHNAQQANQEANMWSSLIGMGAKAIPWSSLGLDMGGFGAAMAGL